MRERLPLLAGLLALAIAIGVGSTLIAGGIRDRNRNDVITVTGSSKRQIASDFIVWDVSITSQQPTTAKALAELDGWTRRTRSFFRASGARPGELLEQPISTETLVAQGPNGSSNGSITGYKLTRYFELRSPRVPVIAAIAEKSSQLFSQGIPLNAQPPQYIYTKLASLRPALLTEAAKDAQGRARALIESTGGKIGHLVTVNVGVFQVTSPNSTQVSDLGVYDTATLRKDVTAVVNATFTLG
jgi:hypothetical protein